MTVSMSGLDLSWMTDPANRLSPRPKKKRTKTVSKRSTAVAAPYFMCDVDQAYGGAWRSIIDGTEISSRTNWREHNKRNQVVQVDPDYWGKQDIVKTVEERMGYDPSLIGKDFTWKTPPAAEHGTHDRREGKRARAKPSGRAARGRGAAAGDKGSR